MRATLALVILLTASGCRDCLTPASPTVPGIYDLVTVNGRPVPSVIAIVPPELFVLTRATLDLRENGTFLDTTIVTTVTEPDGDVVAADTAVRTGTWTFDDPTVMLELPAPIRLTWRANRRELVRFVVDRSASSAPLLDLTLVYQQRR